MCDIWKQVKTRKATKCVCCGVEILQGSRCLCQTVWVVGNPQSYHYCDSCGPQIKAGKSFEEARLSRKFSLQAVMDRAEKVLAAQMVADMKGFLEA